MKISGKWEECKEFIEQMREYVKNPIGFMIFAGKNGNGKTTVAKEIFAKYPTFDSDKKIFTTQFDLHQQWIKQINEWGNVSYLLNSIIAADFLVLDDLGTISPKDAFMEFLYGIADKRYEFKEIKGTIITTNLNSMAMRERFGDAFVSRIASGRCYRFEGDDRRIQEF